MRDMRNRALGWLGRRYLARAEHILFGSDYPLISQRRQRQAIEESFRDDEDGRRLVLGENACRLLRLGNEGKR